MTKLCDHKRLSGYTKDDKYETFTCIACGKVIGRMEHNHTQRVVRDTSLAEITNGCYACKDNMPDQEPTKHDPFFDFRNAEQMVKGKKYTIPVHPDLQEAAKELTQAQEHLENKYHDLIKACAELFHPAAGTHGYEGCYGYYQLEDEQGNYELELFCVYCGRYKDMQDNKHNADCSWIALKTAYESLVK